MKFLCMSVCLLTALGGAVAAQSPTAGVGAGPTNWSGPYVGLSLGYGSSNADIETRGLNGLGAGPVIGPLFDNTVNAIRNGRRPARIGIDSRGFVGGVVGGYNFQPNPNGGLVFGVESDLMTTSLRASNLSIGAFNEPSRFAQDIDFLGTVRGRVGVAFDDVLVYATAGLAFARTSTSATFSGANAGPVAYAGQSNSLVAGAVYGGGVEFRLRRPSPLIPQGGPSMGIGISIYVIDLNDSPQLPVLDSFSGAGFASKPENNNILIGAVRTTFTF